MKICKLFINNLKDKSSRVIIRNITTVDGEESSTIEFVIFSNDLVDQVVSVTKDEEKINCLTRILKTKKVTKIA